MKKITMFISFVGILCFLGCATLPNEERARRYFERGATHLENGDFNRAIAEFDRAIEINPNFAGGYYGRAVAFHNLNRFDLALRDYRKTLEIYPNFIGAGFVNGAIAEILLLQFNDYSNALIYAERSLSIDPNDELALEIIRHIETARAERAAEEARRLAREEANRFNPANFIVVPNNFTPADYRTVDLFQAAFAARNLQRVSNVQEAALGQVMSDMMGGLSGSFFLQFVSDLTFVRQDGLDITFSSDDNAITQRMVIDQSSGLRPGQRVRVFYTITRAPLTEWNVVAIERR